MNTPSIYIIVPVYNRRDVTAGCIDSLAAQSFLNWKLVVVDSESTDGTAEMIKAKLPSSVIVRGHKTWWWARSLHEGTQAAKELGAKPNDIFLFLNDDQVFEAQFLEKAVGLLLNLKNTLLLPNCFSLQTNQRLDHECGEVFDSSQFKFHEAIHLAGKQKITCMTTRALFLRVSDYEKIGPFRYRLLPHYHSDYEFTYRAYKKGYELVCTDKLQVKVRDELTGRKSLRDLPNLWIKVKYAFSEKYQGNPIRLSIFAFLMQKNLYAFRTVARIWTRPLLKKLIKDF